MSFTKNLDANDNAAPPIPDANGNGLLDDEDIVMQLRKEAIGNRNRRADQHAHGVLEATGIRKIAHVVYAAVMNNNRRYQGDELAQVNEELNQQLIKLVYETKARVQGNADVRTSIDVILAEHAKTKEIPQEIAAIMRADAQSIIDFAKTFNTTFPKGVHIQSSHILEIMNHYGPVVPPFLPNTVAGEDTAQIGK